MCRYIAMTDVTHLRGPPSTAPSLLVAAAAFVSITRALPAPWLVTVTAVLIVIVDSLFFLFRSPVRKVGNSQPTRNNRFALRGWRRRRVYMREFSQQSAEFHLNKEFYTWAFFFLFFFFFLLTLELPRSSCLLVHCP